MLTTTDRDAYYTPIEGISNSVTWYLNDPWKAYPQRWLALSCKAQRRAAVIVGLPVIALEFI